MSSAQKTIVTKFSSAENEPIASGSGQNSLLAKAPIIFPSEMMLDFLKCLTWKSLNKCQGIDSKWFYLIKQDREVAENSKSILPRPIFERFEMTKSTPVWNFGEYFKALQNQERHCFDGCHDFTTPGKKPLTITGLQEEQTEIHLGITIVERQYDEVYIFSWFFNNEISHQSLPHIYHWFSHLREPFGAIKEVKLVPFDLKIWQCTTAINPNLLTKFYAETLSIEFEREEFGWVSDFCSKYCTAKRLIWNLVPYKYENRTDASRDKFYAFMKKEEYEDQDAYLNTIINFVEDQGQNFESLKVNTEGWLSKYQFRPKMIEMFKSHPSKLIKTTDFFCSAESFFFINSDPGYIPPSFHKSENSDYILEERVGDEGRIRQVIFDVITTPQYEEWEMYRWSEDYNDEYDFDEDYTDSD